MKKRILSMLLLVAMVVTALPIVALPAIAVESGEKNYSAEDYNALYVQEDLVYALDFFASNSHWSDTSVTYTTKETLVAAIQAASWVGGDVITMSATYPENGSATVAGGFLDMSGISTLNVGAGPATNYGYASTGGATFDTLQQCAAVSQTIFFNNLRTRIYPAGSLLHVGVQVENDSGNSLGAVIGSIKANGQSVVSRFTTEPTSFATVMSVAVPGSSTPMVL